MWGIDRPGVPVPDFGGMFGHRHGSDRATAASHTPGTPKLPPVAPLAEFQQVRTVHPAGWESSEHEARG